MNTTKDDKNDTQRSLTVRSKINQRRLSAVLEGYLDSETVPNLREFLALASTDLAAGVVRDFDLNIAQLYLMSSSAISCLAGWVKTTSDRYPDSRIMFRTNRELSWQQRALAPIRRLAPQSVVVD